MGDVACPFHGVEATLGIDLEMCPTHQVPGANGDPIAIPNIACTVCAAWVQS